LFDFIATLWRAPSKTRYLVTWGWIDFLSSIPMLNALRWGRAARMVRIFRVLRGVRAARVLTLFILGRRAQSVCLAASLVAIILLVVGSVAILQFEHHANSNIKSAEDAVWWSIVTLTTVGYGDRYPVTTEGRVVAAALMVAGVGLFGTLSGFIAAWFLTPEQQHQENEITELRREIRELREALKK
jgi:voltage-gated potassium channel